MKGIGEVIRELRKRDGITQEKLAEGLGVSFQSVSRWENGLSCPDVTLVPLLARYFKVSADTLFDMNDTGTAEREKYYDTTYIRYRKDGNLPLRRELMEQAVREFPHKYHSQAGGAVSFKRREGKGDSLSTAGGERGRKI